MKPIYYRSGKLALTALLCGAAGVFTLSTNDDGSLLSNLFGVMSLIGAGAAGFCGVDPRPAIALNGRLLAVRTMFRRKVVDVRDILVVSVERRSFRLLGVLPLSRRGYLVIRVEGGLTGSQRITLNGGMLALPPGGLKVLCETVKAARGTTSNEATPLLLAPAISDEGGGGFDPDAAIARYLAQKVALPQPAEPPPAAAPLPGPPRAIFGRRVA